MVVVCVVIVLVVAVLVVVGYCRPRIKVRGGTKETSVNIYICNTTPFVETSDPLASGLDHDGFSVHFLDTCNDTRVLTPAYVNNGAAAVHDWS